MQLLDLKNEFMSRMGEGFVFEDKTEKKLTTRLASRAVSNTALAEPSGLPSLPMLMITCAKLEIELIYSTFNIQSLPMAVSKQLASTGSAASVSQSAISRSVAR